MNKQKILKFLFSDWDKELKQLKNKNLYRSVSLPLGLDFSSNDYLSLTQHAGIRKSFVQALRKNLPLSSGASRLIRGHTLFHEETEYLFQKWTKSGGALFFSSGYMANMGLISAIAKDNTMLFSDELNHASLIDGCRLTKSPCCIYKHKNLNHLESLLKKETKKKKIIITESLFSMDGDFAPLEDLSYLALKHHALLIVDEAHSTGLYGPKGAGLCAKLKTKDHIISVHPCGKALCGSGAFVAGPAVLKTYLINISRPFIYSTAPSPALLFYIRCVLQVLQQEPERRIQLKKKIKYFKTQLKNFNKSFSKSAPFDSKSPKLETSNQINKQICMQGMQSPIVPIITGSSSSAVFLQKMLQKKGYDIRAIRYPTVPKGTERLRICIHYNHSLKQLKELAYLLSVKTPK